MVFSASGYWFDVVSNIMVKEGNLRLLADYWLLGLGTGHRDLHTLLEDAEEVTGTAWTIRCFTGRYKGLRVSTVAMAGGGGYAEWAIAMAYRRGVKALIGVGYCGALMEHIEIGDVILPLASIRDENTSDHYVDERFPAVADYNLLKALEDELKARGISPHIGLIITTSATFSESKHWAEELSNKGVLAVECETSVIYVLSRLCRIPASTVLVVSDHVLRGEGPLSRRDLIKKRYLEAARASLEVLHKIAEGAIALGQDPPRLREPSARAKL